MFGTPGALYWGMDTTITITNRFETSGIYNGLIGLGLGAMEWVAQRRPSGWDVTVFTPNGKVSRTLPRDVPFVSVKAAIRDMYRPFASKPAPKPAADKGPVVVWSTPGTEAARQEEADRAAYAAKNPHLPGGPFGFGPSGVPRTAPAPKTRTVYRIRKAPLDVEIEMAEAAEFHFNADRV